jgi:hypothetical protein
MDYMTEKKEVKKLFKFAKKVVSRGILRKIKRLESDKDKIEVLRYSIKTGLELGYEKMKIDLKKKEEEKKDIFIISTKMSLLKSKIKLFDATFHESDFINVIRLFEEIAGGLKNV